MMYRNNPLAVLWVLMWCGSLGCSTAAGTQFPPDGVVIPWDIGPKDSIVEQEFILSQYRWYRLDIALLSTRRHIDPLGETARMKTFTGDGTYGIATKESANTEHPVWIIPHTLEEGRRVAEGIRQGIYVRRSGDPGVIVPVHLRIEQVDNSGATTLHTDQVFDTENYYGAHSTDGLLRKITNIKLRPGKYRFRVSTTKESSLPPNVIIFLKVAPTSNSRVLKDDE